MRTVLTVLLLSACAELPACPSPQVTVYETGKQRLYVLDDEGWATMARMFDGVQNRTCRITFQ